MAEDKYRIFGAEVSPYSVKVRSAFRYKGVPHEWIVRSQATMDEFQKHAKLPLIPLVVTPEGEAWQDSTPILEKLEARFPEPSIHPPGALLYFLSALLEEFGDEWGNKWMFHYRWAREADQISAATRIARTMMPAASGEALETLAAGIRERMVGRVWFVGSSPQTGPQIERSFREGAARIEEHLAASGGRPYLFGGRPAFGDFGLWGQLYNMSTDPTPGAWMREHTPHTLEWCERMLDPQALGDFESAQALLPTLEPLLAEQVAARFLPWSDANARAIEAGQDELRVELAGETWTQKPQKYHARSLAALRERFAAVQDDPELEAVLERTGCLPRLRKA